MWRKPISILFMLFHLGFPHNTTFITPTPNTPCPAKPCYTLSEYSVQLKIHSNTTLVFLPGDHILKHSVSLANLTNITLLGDESSFPNITSRVMCTQPAGFNFESINRLHISLLAFVSCGHTSPALRINSVLQVDISNCSFLNNTNDTPLQDTFGNGGAEYEWSSAYPFGESEYVSSQGGAIYALGSNVTLRSNTFENNFAQEGGAIFAFSGVSLLVMNNTFYNNSASQWGGAIHAEYSKLALIRNTFKGNSAYYDGGALSVSVSESLNVIDNTFENNVAYRGYGGAVYTEFLEQRNTILFSENVFDNNLAFEGGAIFVTFSNLLLTVNTFQDNSATLFGGALSALISNFTLKGSTFRNNSAGVGGALSMEDSITTVTNNVLKNNSALNGGALRILKGNITFTKNRIEDNFAHWGGVVDVRDSATLILLENVFSQNTAIHGGGVSFVTENGRVEFANNTLTKHRADLGGTILAINSDVRLYRNVIRNNMARFGGGILALDSRIRLSGGTVIDSNSANYGGGIYADSSNISGYTTVIGNAALYGGGGIYASRCMLNFSNTFLFIKNVAMDGAGLLLSGNTKISMMPNTSIDFIENSAKQTGGAIKVEESNPLNNCIGTDASVRELSSISDCFFQIETQRKYQASIASKIKELQNVRLHFENNTAVVAGAALYGGSIDNCNINNIQTLSLICPQPDTCSPSGDVFDTIASYQDQDISSDPLYLCTCKDDVIDCNSSFISDPVYPGGTLQVPVVARGQRNGSTPGVIQNITPKGQIIFSEPENTQNTNNHCTALNYMIQSRAVGTSQEMILYAEGPCPPEISLVSDTIQTNTLRVTVKILPCPLGFQLSKYQSACVCAERLQEFTNSCTIDKGTVLRPNGASFWIGYDNESEGLILHPHCPFDYCTSAEVYITVNDNNQQCNFNRSGLLCGQCAQGLSLVLGSSNCLQCSNDYLLLLIAFALAGIALVLLLMALRLTVAVGTINGLIFYANIIGLNSAIFLPVRTTNILTLFIAWLNLDLGFEVCFYDGMDAYAKTWLQFAFPLYVWVLVGVIIFVCHYSSKVATLLGSNPVAVLATLFLLSYAKTLRSVSAAFSYTYLEYPNNSHVSVWLHDGNMKYLSSKHIPLFIAALVFFVFLFLPYTLVLVFGQWIQTNSNWRCFSWINDYRIKPFMDAYHAPYTNKYRYWPGLMLLVRCSLFLVFAFNVLGDPSTNLFAIALLSLLLAVVASPHSHIYRKWYIGVLDISFTLNSGILAAASGILPHSGSNQNVTTFISISIAFATFVGIIIYHLILQGKRTHMWKTIKLNLFTVYPSDNSTATGFQSTIPSSTSTISELHLDLYNHELREPCMEPIN